MSELPHGWGSATLETIAGVDGLVTDGDWIESKDQDPSGGIRLIQLMDIGDGRFLDRSRRFINRQTAERLGCTLLRENDVLIARMPDPLGRACLFPDIGQPAVTAVDVLVWRGGRYAANPEWLVYAINSPQVRKAIEGHAGGTTRQRVAGGRLKALEMPVPPLAEQRRIVTTLDALTDRTARARADLNRALDLVVRQRQAILSAAFNGSLTADWRGRADTAHWAFETAEGICEKVQSGGTPKAGFDVSGVPFLKVYNLVNQEVSFEYKPQYVSEKVHKNELKKSIAVPGDVLMNIVGPPLGKVAMVPPSHPEWNINQAITLFRPGPRVTTEWLYYFLCGGESVQSVINETRGSAGQVNISLSQCRAFLIPLPPLDEQTEIVRRIKRALSELQRLTSHASAARHLLDRLDQQVLAKALRGELVPQNPADEPASVLLERIAAERSAASPIRGRRRTAA